MKRSAFIINSLLTGILGGVNWAFTGRKIPPHNWEGYDFGPPPIITDRLYQGPFSNYGPEANVPGGEVLMTTTPSNKKVVNYGMGFVTYLCDEVGPPKVEGKTLAGSH